MMVLNRLLDKRILLCIIALSKKMPNTKIHKIKSHLTIFKQFKRLKQKGTITVLIDIHQYASLQQFLSQYLNSSFNSMP